MDSVQCSRLLIHIPEMSTAIDEMIRVLRPGGCGVFCEGNFYGQVCYSSDPRLKAIDHAYNAFIISQLAHPGAAMDAYRILLQRSDVVENVQIKPFHVFTS